MVSTCGVTVHIRFLLQDLSRDRYNPGMNLIPDELPMSDAGVVRVGRWMGESEKAQMESSGRVVESNLRGVTSVTSPPNPGLWLR